jgi:hypothetical protein
LTSVANGRENMTQTHKDTRNKTPLFFPLRL